MKFGVIGNLSNKKHSSFISAISMEKFREFYFQAKLKLLQAIKAVKVLNLKQNVMKVSSKMVGGGVWRSMTVWGDSKSK